MCIHPEAVDRVSFMRQPTSSHRRTVYNGSTNLPSKAQWMIRNTNHPETEYEKFAQPDTVQIIS